MSRLLIDPDVMSFVFKNSQQAERFTPHLAGSQLVVAFQTVAELYAWATTRGWEQARIARLEDAIRSCIVVPYTRDLAWSWARLSAQCARVGRSMATGDAWIAAVAILYGIPLVTNNKRHFAAAAELAGLRLLDA